MSRYLRLEIKCTLIMAASFILAACPSPSGDYVTALKKAIGEDVRDFQVLSYPTNSFGVATAFVASTPGTSVSDKDFLCATWKCLGAQGGIAPNSAVESLNITVRGINYAEIGSGGAVKLDADSANDYAFKVALPRIQQVLNLGIGLDYKTANKVELEFGKATKRYLSKPDFIAYINNEGGVSPTKMQLQKALAQGALVVVVADVVLDSIKATVKASNELAPQIDAKLEGLSSKIFSDTQSSFKVTKTDSATYVIESLGPVVALRLLKAQPGGGLLGADNNWNDWAVVSGPTTPIKEMP